MQLNVGGLKICLSGFAKLQLNRMRNETSQSYRIPTWFLILHIINQMRMLQFRVQLYFSHLWCLKWPSSYSKLTFMTHGFWALHLYWLENWVFHKSSQFWLLQAHAFKLLNSFCTALFWLWKVVLPLSKMDRVNGKRVPYLQELGLSSKP